MKKTLGFLLLLIMSVNTYAKGTIHTCNFSETFYGEFLEGQLSIIDLVNVKKRTKSYSATYWMIDRNEVTRTKDVTPYFYPEKSKELKDLLLNDNFISLLNYFKVEGEGEDVKSVRLFDVEPSYDGSSFNYYLITTEESTKGFISIGWGGLLACK